MPLDLGDAELKIGGDAKPAQKAIKSVKEDLDSLAQGATVIGGLFAAAGAGIVSSAIIAINAASDVQESANAVNVVFKEAAGTIFEYGKTSASTAFLSKAAFQEMAVTVGNLMVNYTGDVDEGAEATLALTNRAVDMASVFNKDVDEAMAALEQGIRGETEAMRRFGVDVTDASLAAWALEEGLEANIKTMDPMEKALLRYELIMDRTAQVQGDAAATAGGYANVLRRLQAEAQDLAAEIGEELLPTAEELLRDVVMPLVEETRAWISENKALIPVIVKAGIVVGGLGVGLMAVGFAVPLVTSGLGFFTGAAGLATKAGALLLDGVKAMTLANGRLAASWIVANLPLILLGAAVIAAAFIVVAYWEEIEAVIDQALKSIGAGLTNFLEFFENIWVGAGKVLGNAQTDQRNTYHGMLKDSEDFASDYSKTEGFFDSLWHNISYAIEGHLIKIAQSVKKHLGILIPVAGIIGGPVGTVLSALGGFAISRLIPDPPEFTSDFKGLKADFGSKSFMEDIAKQPELVSGGVDKPFYESIFEGVKDTVTGLWEDVSGRLAEKGQSLLDQILGLGGNIDEAFKDGVIEADAGAGGGGGPSSGARAGGGDPTRSKTMYDWDLANVMTELLPGGGGGPSSGARAGGGDPTRSKTMYDWDLANVMTELLPGGGGGPSSGARAVEEMATEIAAGISEAAEEAQAEIDKMMKDWEEAFLADGPDMPGEGDLGYLGHGGSLTPGSRAASRKRATATRPSPSAAFRGALDVPSDLVGLWERIHHHVASIDDTLAALMDQGLSGGGVGGGTYQVILEGDNYGIDELFERMGEGMIHLERIGAR